MKKKNNPNTWESEGYTFSFNIYVNDGAQYSRITVFALAPSGDVIGKYEFTYPHGEDYMVVIYAFTISPHQRKGLANKAYVIAETITGRTLVADEDQGGQTLDAKKFWKQTNRPFGKK
jgi:hypothetical protein